MQSFKVLFEKGSYYGIGIYDNQTGMLHASIKVYRSLRSKWLESLKYCTECQNLPTRFINK